MRKPYLRPGSKILQITVHGVPRSSGTDSLEAATALQEKLNGAVSAVASEDPGQCPHSWEELVLEWTKRKHKKISWNDDVWKLRWLHPYMIGFTDIRKIKRRVFADIIESSREVDLAGPSPKNTTANHFVVLVQSMLNMACERLEWMDAAPKLLHYEQPKSPMISLTYEKWIALKNQLPSHLVDPVTFAVATGLRRDKVFFLEWSWIDFEERRLTFQGNAIKLGNSIPLNDTAMEILTRLRNAPFRHIRRVFVYKNAVKAGSEKKPSVQPLAGFGTSWYKAMERAGLGNFVITTDAAGKRSQSWDGDFHFHGLRKTFATWLKLEGVPKTAIDELCGWTAGAGTQALYTEIALKDKPIDHLRAYTGRIDAILSGAVRPGKKAKQNAA